MSVAVHFLVDHGNVTVDLLATLLYRPILATLPSATFVCPAKRTIKSIALTMVLMVWYHAPTPA